MWRIVLYFSIFFVIIGLMARGMSLLLSRLLGKTIGDRHRAAEVIVNTGNPPKQWTEPWIRRMEVAQRKAPSGQGTPAGQGTPSGQGAAAPRRTADLKGRAKEKILYELDALTHYFKNAPCFDSAETKELLLSKLADARTNWEARDWDTMVRESEEPGG